MSRLLSNFGSGLTRTAQGIYARLFAGYTTAPAVRPTAGTSGSGPARLANDAYRVRDLMLAGTVYAARAGLTGGGYLYDIQQALGKPSAADDPPILPYYNPVPAIVGCYQNAIGGRLGEELKVERPNGDPLKKAVADAIARVWRWSNLDTSLEELVTLVANQGMAGIRIVSQGQGAEGRVFLRFDHPEKIFDAEEDARGNLLKIRLKYNTYYSDTLDGQYTTAEVDEVIGKDGFSQLVDGYEQLEPDQQRNALGVCPYVPIRHARRNGEFYGRHAYEGSELAIHGINWGLSQLDEAVARSITETVFMAGAGDAPSEITLGRLQAIYVKLAQGVPAPELKYIVPQLALAETGESILRNVELLYTRQPELILNALKLLSGTSGETLAQVLKPVEAAVLRARRMYESAIVAALQIALSAGVLMGLWDLGTGTGTAEAADRAYDDGQGPESFRFADRPALPMSTAQRLAEAQAAVADRKARLETANLAKDVSQRERLRIAGYTDAEIEQIEAEKAEEDVLDSEDENVDAE